VKRRSLTTGFLRRVSRTENIKKTNKLIIKHENGQTHFKKHKKVPFFKKHKKAYLEEEQEHRQEEPRT